ncbi:MAG TPA: HemK2/MTQ2 family protein methyltransferase [Candidatus Nanoarchaeia archaeon]|nr:HemK2/MTQ2 family protein methyltransferase [Candidatus Nanoarchaeia archaeon]
MRRNYEIYHPSEDSYFLSDILKKEIKIIENYKDKCYFEVGCGGGIQLETLERLGINKNNIYSCDINPKAVEKCRKKGFNSIESDIFSNINKKKKFDIIIFNPPYLPEDKNKKEPEDSKKITTGGKKGGEIINSFLEQVKGYLNKKGIIFILTSSLTKNINWSGFKKTKIAEKNLFFEKLYVWKLIM